MSLPQQIFFNRKRLSINRDKAAMSGIDDHPLFKYAADDILSRLEMLDRSFLNILNIGCRNGYLPQSLVNKNNNAQILVTDISIEMLKQVTSASTKLLIDEEKLDFVENEFDLIVFSLGLQWINDIQQFLKNIYSWLSKDGLFVVNFIGGNSLKSLRQLFIQAEIESGKAHSIHIPPFIHFDHLLPLLQQAGFQDIIIDFEKIQLEYPSAFALLKAIKIAGESNILINIPNYAISKNMLKILKNDKESFHTQLEMISFISGKSKKSIRLKASGYTS